MKSIWNKQKRWYESLIFWDNYDIDDILQLEVWFILWYWNITMDIRVYQNSVCNHIAITGYQHANWRIASIPPLNHVIVIPVPRSFFCRRQVVRRWWDDFNAFQCSSSTQTLQGCSDITRQMSTSTSWIVIPRKPWLSKSLSCTSRVIGFRISHWSNDCNLLHRFTWVTRATRGMAQLTNTS